MFKACWGLSQTESSRRLLKKHVHGLVKDMSFVRNYKVWLASSCIETNVEFNQHGPYSYKDLKYPHSKPPTPNPTWKMLRRKVWMNEFFAWLYIEEAVIIYMRWRRWCFGVVLEWARSLWLSIWSGRPALCSNMGQVTRELITWPAFWPFATSTVILAWHSSASLIPLGEPWHWLGFGTPNLPSLDTILTRGS